MKWISIVTFVGTVILRIQNSNAVTKGNYTSLEKLTLERVTVAAASISSNLKYLDLRYVTLTEGIMGLANVVRKNTNLEILRLEHVNGVLPTLAIPKSLRVLWIYGSEGYSFLKHTPTETLKNLEVFQIPQELDASLIANFDTVFPNLKYASLSMGPRKYELLIKLVKISNIQKILLWGTGWGNWGSYGHMTELNYLFKNVTGDEHFVIERNLDDVLVARPLPKAEMIFGVDGNFTYIPAQEYDAIKKKYFESYFGN